MTSKLDCLARYALWAGTTAACAISIGTVHAQTPARGAASTLPPITVQEPERRAARTAPARTTRAARGPSRRAATRAPTPAAPTASAQPARATSTMNVQPSYAGGQVARGGQVGVLGNLDYMSTPFSTQNFTAQFIANRQATSIQDVLITDPSISMAQGGSRGATDYMKFRGFATYAGTEQSAVNGLAGVSAYLLPSPEFLERLELIRGANSFLNGNVGAVGGSVNAITKRGTDRPVADVTLQYGSRGQVGGAFDVGGRWGDTKEYGVRINALHRDGDLAPEGAAARQTGVSVGWDYRGDRFRIDADFVYRDQAFWGDPYYSTLADPSLGLPQPTANKNNLTAPWMYNSAEEILAMTRAEYDISDNWTIAAAYGHSTSNSRFNSYCFNVINNLRGDATCNYGAAIYSNYERDAANVALRGIFDTGVVKHRFAVGGNFMGEEQSAKPNISMPAIDFNIYAPAWPSEFAKPNFGPTAKQAEFATKGGFITDTLSVLDERLNLTVGVRQTLVDQKAFDTLSGLRTSDSATEATTPVFGALVKVTPWLSLYGNYIEALERGGIAPQTAANPGQIFKPLVSKQYEGGAKLDFQTIGASFAYFDITKANEYTDAATQLFTQNGRQQNKGVEITVFGEPVKGVRFLGGASWIDARLVSNEDPTVVGNRAPSVPAYELRMTGEVDLPFVPGATVTAAVFHSGPAAFDNANTFNVPAWTRVDLGGRYVYWIDKTKVTARLNVENLTDEAYWIAGYGSGSVAQSGARRFVMSMTASF